MWWPGLIMIGVILLLFPIAILWNRKVNKEINQNGVEADAVVTRVQELTSCDSDGTVSVSHIYFVTFRALDGQEVEARLGSGKSVDVYIGGGWDKDLREGVSVRIKYLPEKPKYAILVTDR